MSHDREPARRTEPKHCDEYIHDHSAPMPLRWFLFVNRLPAVEKLLCDEHGVRPTLYADRGGQRVRVVMASRLGDVGITSKLDSDQYEERVPVEALSNFAATEHEAVCAGHRAEIAELERRVRQRDARIRELETL